MEEPNSNGDKRNPDGTFAPGYKGGPGRPVGSVSIVGKIKKKFEENPEYFDEWIGKLMEDPANRRAIMEQIDGKPKQPIVGDANEPLVLRVIKYDGNDNNSVQLPTEEISA